MKERKVELSNSTTIVETTDELFYVQVKGLWKDVKKIDSEDVILFVENDELSDDDFVTVEAELSQRVLDAMESMDLAVAVKGDKDADLVLYWNARSSEPEVPSSAERLLGWALPADMQEGVLGDLEEGFKRRSVKDGERAAVVWYWLHAVRSLIPLAGRAVLKALLFRELLERLRLF